MTQEVRVIVQLGLEVDTEINKERIQSKLINVLKSKEFKDAIFYYFPGNLVNNSIISIEEEAEIYGTEL